MQKWEYLRVTQGYIPNSMPRPRNVNGKELPNWEKGSSIYEFIDQLGEQGWELVATVMGDQMIFKRLKA